MTLRSATSFFGGFALGAAAADATTALVAMPRLAVAAFGLVCIAAAVVRRPQRGRIGAIVAGLALALALPKAPLPTAVMTRSPGGSHAGDLFALLELLDGEPTAVLDRTVSITGSWAPREGSRDATVSRRVMTCCAADAVSVGFDVVEAHAERIRAGSFVRVTGILGAALRDGELRYVIRNAAVRERAP